MSDSKSYGMFGAGQICCAVSGPFDWYMNGAGGFDALPLHYLQAYDYIWRSASVKPRNAPSYPDRFNSLVDNWMIDMNHPEDLEDNPDRPLRGKHKANHGTIFAEEIFVFCARFSITEYPEDADGNVLDVIPTHIGNVWHDSVYNVSMEKTAEQGWTGWTLGVDTEGPIVGGADFLLWQREDGTPEKLKETWLGISRTDKEIPTDPDLGGHVSTVFTATQIVYEFRTLLKMHTAYVVRVQITITGGDNDGEVMVTWLNAYNGDVNTTHSSQLRSGSDGKGGSALYRIWKISATQVHPDHYDFLIFNEPPYTIEDEVHGGDVEVPGVDLTGANVEIQYRLVDGMSVNNWNYDYDGGLNIDWHSIKPVTTLGVGGGSHNLIDYVVYQKAVNDEGEPTVTGDTSADNGVFYAHYMADTTHQITYTYPKTALDLNSHIEISPFMSRDVSGNWIRLPTPLRIEGPDPSGIIPIVPMTKNVSDMMLVHSCRMNGYKAVQLKEKRRFVFTKGTASDWGKPRTSTSVIGGGLAGWKHGYNVVNPYSGLSMGSILFGDFDGDGDVDGSDFLEWQREDTTPEGLDNWKTNFVGAAMSTLSCSIQGISVMSIDTSLLHDFSTGTTAILEGVSASNFEGYGGREGNPIVGKHDMLSILYPREDYEDYSKFDTYDDDGDIRDCHRGSGAKENAGPKADAQIVMSSTRVPGWAWMIKDARDYWVRAPDDPGGGVNDYTYDFAAWVRPTTHRVSIGLGKIKQKSNQRYREVDVIPGLPSGVVDHPNITLGVMSLAYISSAETYLTGSTGTWWERAVTDTKLLFFQAFWQRPYYNHDVNDNLKNFYPPTGDVGNRPLVWANINWADAGTLTKEKQDCPIVDTATSNSDGSGKVRYKAAIIQWGKATPAYEDANGNYKQYPTVGTLPYWVPTGLEEDGFEFQGGDGPRVGWEDRSFGFQFEPEPPAWWYSYWEWAQFRPSAFEFWRRRAPRDSYSHTSKDRAGNVIDRDDFNSVAGTIMEYFLCVAGAKKGTGSGHELYDDKGVFKGSFEIPIWRKHAWYWGDPNDRDPDWRSDGSIPDYAPRINKDMAGDECWYWGLYIDKDVMIWFERLGDPNDPLLTIGDENHNIVHHTEIATDPCDPPIVVLPPEVDPIHYSPELPDNPKVQDDPLIQKYGSVPIGWRMHSLNKRTGAHYTLDTEWPHPRYWERTLEKGHTYDHQGIYEPQRLFPEVRAISQNHIYISGFVLTDTRAGLEEGFFTKWVITHDLSYMWPNGEIIERPDPKSANYPDGHWISGPYHTRQTETGVYLHYGSQGLDVVKIPDDLSPALHEHGNRIPTRKYGDGSPIPQY